MHTMTKYQLLFLSYMQKKGWFKPSLFPYQNKLIRLIPRNILSCSRSYSSLCCCSSCGHRGECLGHIRHGQCRHVCQGSGHSHYHKYSSSCQWCWYSAEHTLHCCCCIQSCLKKKVMMFFWDQNFIYIILLLPLTYTSLFINVQFIASVTVAVVIARSVDTVVVAFSNSIGTFIMVYAMLKQTIIIIIIIIITWLLVMITLKCLKGFFSQRFLLNKNIWSMTLVLTGLAYQYSCVYHCWGQSLHHMCSDTSQAGWYSFAHTHHCLLNTH